MWRKKVGIEPNRIVSIFLVATVAALLMATPLTSLVTTGDVNASMGGETVAREEDLKKIVAEDTPILPQIQGIDPSLKSGYGPTPIEFDVELVQDAELGDLRLQDNVNKPLGEDKPSPMGSPDPEPMDAPFLASDVLVYNDAVNSEKNVSLAKTTNGDLYVAYDHDIGTGLRDVYVSKSTDGGLTWAKRDIGVDAAEDESCPTIAGDYSPTFAADVLYAWYNNPTLEFAWSLDGDTWNIEDFGGGITWWDLVNCPYVDVKGDMMVIISEWYDTNNNIDTLRVLYAVDGLSWTTYYLNLWAGAWVYQPRVSIQSVDTAAGEGDVVITMTIHDRSDPNPANWFYEAVLTDATFTGDVSTDSWGAFYYMSGVPNLDPVAPDVAANDREVIFVMSLYNPSVLPLTTMYTWCLWADDVDDIGSASWNYCAGTGFLTFDPNDLIDQKYVKLHREGTGVHAVWLNGTDINYMFSPNGGANWIGPPMKVNDLSSSTAIDAFHSPDVTLRDGKAAVAWHDSRGSDNVYFQTFENSRWYEIRADPYEPNLGVREVGDSWHTSSYYYLWADASVHDVEATGAYEIPTNTRYTFNQWDDGSLVNPTTVTVSPANYDITAIYDVEFYLMLNGGPGTTTPASNYQPAYTWVTIEAFPPAVPPGGRYLFMGWTGDVNNNTNPCIDCVYMNGTKTIWANWILQWNVTIFTDPVPLTIQVNGFDHTAPYTTWFNDSEVYIINATSPQNVGPTMRYTWTHWSDAGLQSHDVSVTAPGTNFTAFYTVEFNVTVDTDPTGLQVRINMVNYMAPYSFWCPEFASPFLEAPSPQDLGVPGERYIWRDWSDGGAQLHQHTCVGAETVIANYTFQRRVTVDTVPTGLTVIVDGQMVPTPIQFWWNDTSAHTIEALDFILIDANNRYNFTGWSDFGARIHTYWTNTSDDTVTAFYDIQYKIMLRANHSGLTIDLDGSPIALPYDYWCDTNSMHLLSAPAIQQFGDTRYIFESWSDGGAPTHFFTCFAPDIITVNYAKEYRVFINSTLDGNSATLDVIVGGTTYSTPVELWWPADTMMVLDTVEFQPSQDPMNGVRFRFLDWDDSGIKARNVVVNAPGLAYVANFGTQFKLTFVDSYGTPMTTPAGWPVTDGVYFDSGTLVQISTDDAVPDTIDHRWRFDVWSSVDPNGYTGPNNPATITMDNPITQTASWADQYLLTIVSSYGTPVATGWYEQHAPHAYWYDMGDIATFWVDNEVIISGDEKAVFDMWVGGTNGTLMNAGLTVIAVWDWYYMVTVNSPHGTPPASTWVIEDGSFFLDIEEYVRVGDSRHEFDGWTTPDTSNGGYQGPNRQVVLTVTGPITETANWQTQHLLTIVTDYGTPTASGWEDQESATAFWYAEGDSATFWIEDEVFISTEQDAKAVFEEWSGASNGTTMNSPVEVTAVWHLDYLVAIESEFGVGTPDTWVRNGETHQITINDIVYDISFQGPQTRHVFLSWSTDDTDNGGYQGTDRNTTLTVTGPIVQMANWVTQHYIRITSTYGEEPDTLGDPRGEGWYNESSVATIEVAGSETKGGWVYKFENWVGEVDDHISNKTTVTVDGPRSFHAVWSKSEETQPLSILTWLAIVIVVIAVVVAIALLLMKRKKTIEAETPQTVEEESPTEETPDEIESGVEVEGLQ